MPSDVQEYGRQMQYIGRSFTIRVVAVQDTPHLLDANTTPYLTPGDTKAGALVGTDRYGNKYYENIEEELPRTLPPSPSSLKQSLC